MACFVMRCGASRSNDVLWHIMVQVTVLGDLAVAGAAAAGVGYLLIGRHLRSWMPIFIYAFVVTGACASLSTTPFGPNCKYRCILHAALSFLHV